MINSLFALSVKQRKRLSDTHCGMRILSLFEAYGGNHSFCMFYETDCGMICSFYSTVIYCGEEIDEETKSFIFLNAPLHIEIPLKMAKKLDFTGYNKIKRYCFEFSDVNFLKHVQFEINPNLHDVFKIIGSSFNIEKDEDIWFVDMSHKIRHGISKVYKYGNSVAVNEYLLGGKAYFSQVATSFENRRCGSAKALLTCIAKELKEKNIKGFLFAEDDLCGFYEKIGFNNIGYNYCFERVIY